MSKLIHSLALSFVLAAPLAACGGEEIVIDPKATGGKGQFSTASKISAFLDGKTLQMAGGKIPTHPNGLDEDVNYGQATQCYKEVTMEPSTGRYRVVSQLGTLNGAPNSGDRGSCDHGSMSAELSFDSTAVLIENVRDNGGCFDFTITYPGFGQEGRGKLNADGSELVLELFFKDRATGHRCGDGEVGDPTITLSQMPFTGNALQTYAIVP